MKRTDRRLEELLARSVAAEHLPAAPLADWLSRDAAAGKGDAPELKAALPLVAHWPEDLELRAPAGLVTLAASVVLAGGLAILQASGWTNPIDRGAARLFADETVREQVQAALRMFADADVKDHRGGAL